MLDNVDSDEWPVAFVTVEVGIDTFGEYRRRSRLRGLRRDYGPDFSMLEEFQICEFAPQVGLSFDWSQTCLEAVQTSLNRALELDDARQRGQHQPSASRGPPSP